MTKISVSGLRGIWGESLDHNLIVDYVKSYIKYLNPKTLAIATDTRRSRNVIRSIVISVLHSYGIKIIDIGISPTPLLLYTVNRLNLDGGIVITSSHNPPMWNGLKFVKKGGVFLDSKDIEEIVKNFNTKNFMKFSIDTLSEEIKEFNIIETYIKEISSYIDLNTIREKKFKVSIDAGNGAVINVIEEILKNLNIKYTLINTKIGVFERNPEPVPEALSSLVVKVKEDNSDIGFAYDPDADRLAIVTSEGPIGEDYTLAISYLNILDKGIKTDIVINYSTSTLIDEIAGKFNQKVYRAKVGEINVTKEIENKKTIIGGEGNGGVILYNFNKCRDSIVATLMILEYMARKNKKILEIIEDLPKFYIIKDKIEASWEKSIEEYFEEIINRKKIKTENISYEDGIWLKTDDGFIHVRGSNTEPIIRIIGESKNKKLIESLIKEIKDELGEKCCRNR